MVCINWCPILVGEATSSPISCVIRAAHKMMAHNMAIGRLRIEQCWTCELVKFARQPLKFKLLLRLGNCLLRH